MSKVNYSGLETSIYAYRNQVKRESDLIALFVHWYLVKNDFVCVIDGKKTEILPENWNESEEIYVINYSLDSKGYELKILNVDKETCIVNLMKKSTERTASFSCVIKNHISNLRNEYQNLFMNLNDLHEMLSKEFTPLFKEESSKSTSGTQSRESGASVPRPNPPEAIYDPLRIGGPVRPPLAPVGIGRSDLDPFSFDPLGTGGMVFDPFRNYDRRLIPTNLPPGAVPPRARFDPYGPPNPDELIPGSSTRVGPNPNHLRPPGGFGNDHMFM
ncbi:unnamed protein product [Brachionus calyciflorus]|uniref:Proteasome inhibitor PI31 subunit n=1 Tax=Brachionus calyciflorus TaxID=104777 RepID=A0A813SDP5_9BILA|nr:unnamed protein product [Brachionus calyciflorus]